MGAVASCGTSGDPVAAADPAPATGSGTAADVSPAGSFAPLHLTGGDVFTSAPDLTLTGEPSTIDTQRLTIDGASNAFFLQRHGYAVLFASHFVAQHDVAVTGTRPLIIVAYSDAAVLGSIDLSAHGAAPGPGAAVIGPGLGGPGDTFQPPGAPERESSGGGGAGHGSPGAPGGSSAEAAPPGTAGTVYGAQPSDPLVGGAPGGVGGDVGPACGAGGHAAGAGGGALQISSATSISITGPHIAAGGGGGGAGGGPLAGSGGGAGGEILLEAPTLSVASASILAANGGGGGGGDGVGIPSGPGSDAIIGDTPAPGGTAGAPMGSSGGAGAAGQAGGFVDAQTGGGGNSVGGGGGGGAGRIWLRYRAATPPVTTGAVISPPAGLDPTLP